MDTCIPSLTAFLQARTAMGMQVSIDKAVEIEEKLFGGCFETHDQVEGMACFLSREKPKPKAVFTNS